MGIEIRDATASDWERIRTIAEQTFDSSYSLSPDQITTILDHVFSDAALSDRVEDPTVRLFVAEGESEAMEEAGVVGFADVVLDDGVTVRWLHVDPNARGAGVGTALVERARAELDDTDEAPFAVRVLEEAVECSDFLEQFGLHRTGSDTFEFDGETLIERVHTEGGKGHKANEPVVEVPGHVDVDGDRRPINRDDSIPGTDAPFFRTFTSESREENYGYFCSNCASTDVSSDSLGRIACSNCGNTHLADEWDAAYL